MLEMAKAAKNVPLVQIMTARRGHVVSAEQVSTESKTSVERRSVADKTRLRVIGQPDSKWHYGSEVTLREIKARVRNVGDSTANAVRIEAILPEGKAIILAGPNSLQRNQHAEYSFSGSQPVTSAGRMKFKPSCANCW